MTRAMPSFNAWWTEVDQPQLALCASRWERWRRYAPKPPRRAPTSPVPVSLTIAAGLEPDALAITVTRMPGRSPTVSFRLLGTASLPPRSVGRAESEHLSG